jgi:hypothetical protein
MLEDIARACIRRRKFYDRMINVDEAIKVTGNDISARDNAALAAAASTIIGGFAVLRDRGLIDDQELMRIAYRFAGEVVDVEELLERGAKAPPPKYATGTGSPALPGGRPGGIDIDPIRGEPEGIEVAAPAM